MNDLKEKLGLLCVWSKVRKAISKSKFDLMQTNKNFDKSTEKDMKDIYDMTDQIMIDLAVERERERNLINQRNDLEVRVKA